jgi:hypothetical protein
MLKLRYLEEYYLGKDRKQDYDTEHSYFYHQILLPMKQISVV